MTSVRSLLGSLPLCSSDGRHRRRLKLLPSVVLEPPLFDEGQKAHGITLKVINVHYSAISTMNGHCYYLQTLAFVGLLICLAHWTEGKTVRHANVVLLWTANEMHRIYVTEKQRLLKTYSSTRVEKLSPFSAASFNVPQKC